MLATQVTWTSMQFAPPAGVMALAAPVFAWLGELHRRSEEPPTCEDAEAQAVALFRRIAKSAESDPVGATYWPRVRNPLCYLVDEYLIRLYAWPYREAWEERALELRADIGGHDQRLRDLLFFEELSETLRLHDSAADPSARRAEQELLAIFLLALRMGFRGQHIGDERAIGSIQSQLEDKLRLAGTPQWLTPSGYARQEQARSRWPLWTAAGLAVVMLAVAGWGVWRVYAALGQVAELDFQPFVSAGGNG